MAWFKYRNFKLQVGKLYKTPWRLYTKSEGVIPIDTILVVLAFSFAKGNTGWATAKVLLPDGQIESFDYRIAETPHDDSLAYRWKQPFNPETDE